MIGINIERWFLNLWHFVRKMYFKPLWLSFMLMLLYPSKHWGTLNWLIYECRRFRSGIKSDEISHLYFDFWYLQRYIDSMHSFSLAFVATRLRKICMGQVTMVIVIVCNVIFYKWIKHVCKWCLLTDILYITRHNITILNTSRECSYFMEVNMYHGEIIEK